MSVYLLTKPGGGKNTLTPQAPNYSEQIYIAPHARTIRNAREQVRLMVIDGFSTPRIKRYLGAWLRWWVRTSQSFQPQSLLSQFIHSCYDARIAGIAIELLLINYHEQRVSLDLTAQQDFQETA
ncbi:Uncharacterised protein [Legionella sainthelensi]|nr:Uncharacterised protein [Legionella sainthelensi]